MNDDAKVNRKAWDAIADEYQQQHHEQLRRNPAAWGVWSLPESELQLLGEVRGRDVLEYGCGGAQWSIALARRGARCVALDNSERQLEHAARAIEEADVDVRLVHAAAETMPFADASFDVVFCDHGAMSFAAPEITIPQVARVLRPGGVFCFSVEHPVHACSWNPETLRPSRTLHTSYFEDLRFVDPDDGTVSHARSVSAYFALLTASGFVVERLLEPRPPTGAATTYEVFAPIDVARDVPAELIFKARAAAAP